MTPFPNFYVLYLFCFLISEILDNNVNTNAVPIAITIQMIMANALPSFANVGAIKVGTYAVHFTPNAPTNAPEMAADRMPLAKTFLLENMNGYAASTKVPKNRLMQSPGTDAATSPFALGFTIFAKRIPAQPSTRPHISIAPRKELPVVSISNNTIGRIAA